MKLVLIYLTSKRAKVIASGKIIINTFKLFWLKKGINIFEDLIRDFDMFAALYVLRRNYLPLVKS